ncbi:outer membrane protein assembly factor BamE [Acidocella aminolytica]|uniref:Lipoprotein SmpA/OmlA n=1 Tax=Acidocella aminolytica 101 = DSM 11237 TaxID=1120923 RepID=A0A0D6PCS8_9PROT|nr:outer membrane protein assembly factor BamE [Acidocella aminolytica]GAN78649.1 lipoprotein SmpA/OmlA [Acidocella aminolytica 101 = DSM 11237]GBQ36740.1 lipoprotein OmlA [Acidocella aminolytica 101 = DSM 11237]SHE44313.1 Beta-barrel assembly machine subunit BamE [Acidocella aminolytica 101 = DSM 11237]
MRLTKLPKSLLFCAILALPGCAVFSDSPHYRGIAVTASELKQLTPGVSQQADVQSLLGPPTFVEQFNPNNWVYVAQVTRMRIARTEGVSSQDVVVVSFNSNGTYKSYTENTLANALPVKMDGKETPVPGGTAGFFQQLIGGVGSYNPLGVTGNNSALGGTSGNIGSGGSGSGF